MSRILKVAAAQSGPIQKAESRQAVVKRLCDLLDQAHAQGVNFVVSPSSRSRRSFRAGT